jgi:hypothetical protein
VLVPRHEEAGNVVFPRSELPKKCPYFRKNKKSLRLRPLTPKAQAAVNKHPPSHLKVPLHPTITHYNPPLLMHKSRAMIAAPISVLGKASNNSRTNELLGQSL